MVLGASIKTRPITLNGTKLVFDHKLVGREERKATRAGGGGNHLERPPASQYNLPPRWSLIKKVLGDPISPPHSL